MVALAAAFIRLRPSVDRAEFKRAGEQSGAEAGSAAGKAYGDGFYRDAAGRVRTATGRFASDAEKAAAGFGSAGRSGGRAFGDGLSSGLSGSTFSKVAAIMASRFALIGGAAAASTPALINFTAALAPAAGALVAMPAAVGAFTIATATLRVAIGETSNAIGKGLTGTTEQYKKALEDLTPAQARAAQAVIAFRSPILAVRNTISERFFRPFVDDIDNLARSYLPLARVRLGDLAGSLGGLGEEFVRVANKTTVFLGVGALLRQTRNAAVELRGAIAPIGVALGATFTATAPLLPRIAAGFVTIAREVGAFVTQAARSGQLTTTFNNAVATLRDLGAILFNIGSIIRSVFQAAETSGGGLLGNLRALTAQAAAFLNSATGFGALTSVFSTLNALGAAFRTALAGVLPQIAAGLATVGPALSEAAGPAAQLIVALAPLIPALASSAALIITTLTPALAALARFLSQNEQVLKGLLIAFGAFRLAVLASSAVLAVQAAGGVLAFARATTIATTATKLASAAQIVFGAALRFALGPIGLIITAIGLVAAAVVYLWKNNETFRNIVMAVWSGIKTAISAVGAWFTGTLVPALVGAYDTVKNAALFLWRNVITPAWNGIKAVIGAVVGFVIGYFNAYMAALRAIGSAVVAVYQAVFRPIFSAIGKVIEIWWFAVRVVFNAFKLVLTAAVTATIERAKSVFQAVFAAISGYVAFWWSGVRNIFNLFRTYVLGPVISAVQSVGAFFARIFTAIGGTISRWYGENVKPNFDRVRTVFTQMAAGFSIIYNTKIKPLFDAFIGFLRDKVVRGFQLGVDAIRTAWAKVQDAAKKPVAFVVNKVINPFIGGLNKAAGIVGMKERLEPIKGFERGGQIPGRPSYSDNMIAGIRGTSKRLAVASGEFLTNTRSTLANLPLLKAINAKRGKVTRADLDPVLDGRSRGGPIGDGIGDFFKRIRDGAKGVGSFIANPKEGLKKVADAALARVPGAGILRDVVIGAGRKLIGSAANLLGSIGLGGIGGTSVLGGYRGMQRLISERFPGLGMISGFRPGARTLSGNPSYHGIGRAVDYPPVRALAAWIRSNFGARTKELITPFQDLNLLNGRPHTYTGAVWNQHNFAGGNAHVHWAAELGGLVSRLSGMPVKLFDSGGWWPSGTLGANMSGRAEYVSPNRPPGGDIGGGVTVVIKDSVIASAQHAEDLVVQGYNAAKRKKRIK